MSVQSRSVTPIAIIVASVVLALSLVGSPSISAVAAAVDVVPATAPVAVADSNEQAQGDETLAGPSQLQMMNNDDDFWNGWWIIMPIMMVLFWGGVLGVVVWGIRQFTGDRKPGRSPLDIAKERLAGGEITKEEFDRIKVDLV